MRLGPTGADVREVAAATPASRDRLVDFLRVASILVVVVGHWLMATVVRDGNEFAGQNALASMRWLAPVTWVLQVMPVFFVVGGFANHRALRRRGPGELGTFLARRADRLLRPTVVFASVWFVLAALLTVAPLEDKAVRAVTRVAAQPLWFLAVYLLVILVAPLQLRIHRRWRWALPLGLPALAAALDAFRLTDTASGVAIANYLVVFLFAQELGFLYADGTLGRISRRVAALVAVGAAVTLAVLTTAGPYPVSMVGLPGDRFSNMSPPTICIVVLTVGQVGLVLAARPHLERWLHGPRVWQAVVAVNVVVLTTFLWHLTAYVAAGGALIGAGVPLPEVGTAGWWVLRPVWLAAAAAVLVLLVLAFGRVEQRGPFVGAAPDWARALGTLLAVRGLVGLALGGFAHATTATGRTFLGTRFAPLVDVALLVVGWLLARGVRLPSLRAQGSEKHHRGERAA